MQAEDVQLISVLHGPKQFIIPVFQRDYSWGTKQCLQLWNDVVRVGADSQAKAHFVGSVVYIAAEDSGATIPRWLVIDGQQRLTTITLLLLALRERLPEPDDDTRSESDGQNTPSRPELEDYYLRNQYGRGDRKYKLHLRRADQETLVALLEGKKGPSGRSERVQENFEFFRTKLESADPHLVFAGMRKLIAVDVSLVRGQDDPQMIFESLNSTGLDLTQADLIRNYVLMSQDEVLQTRLYEEHWQPLERAFGKRYGTDFDKFVRDYLVLRLKPSRPLKADEIYHHFRGYWQAVVGAQTPDGVLRDLTRFGEYYARYNLDQEQNVALRAAQRRLRRVVDVASPVIMRLYDCYEDEKTLTLEEFVAAVELLESYVFRRSVCDMQTRSLGQIFTTLANRLTEDRPMESLKVALFRQGKSRRFPTDADFRESLETRNVYDLRHCHYLLSRLENDSKEKVDTKSYTIEHVMPQNEVLDPAWQAMLGPDWKGTQERWLHRLGNLTLTGYNTEYSDRPFEEKKAMPKGFAESPLRLNKFVKEQPKWTAAEMEIRGQALAEQALPIWAPLRADLVAVRNAELADRKSAAAQYDLASVGLDSSAEKVLELLRPQVTGLGEDVVELLGAKNVTYRVYEYFLQVLPRKGRVFLLMNLDFDEIDDPSGRATDTTTSAFVLNATEEGGVGFDLRVSDDIPVAMHLVRQAYERVSG